MDRLDNFFFERSTAHVRLVGHHHKQKTGLLQLCTGGGNLGKNFKFVQVPGGIRFAVTLQRAVDNAIAVEKNGVPGPGLRISDFGLHRVLSHLVLPTLSTGWETNKCQITA